MMASRAVLFLILLVCCIQSQQAASGEDGQNKTSEETVEAVVKAVDGFDYELHRQRMENQTKRIEKGLQRVIKDAVKRMLPGLMDYNKESKMSTKCMGAFMKYISGLTSIKLWALKMLDATSKPPSGILEGTWSDFGSFDLCLDIELPTRKGDIEFRGQYCAVEARPHLSPVPQNFSLAKQSHAGPLDRIGKEFVIGGTAFYYLKFRLGVCVPSVCTLEEMQAMAVQISKQIDMNVEIPQCYVKKSAVFEPIHIAVMCIIAVLLSICIVGSVVEYKHGNSENALGRYQKILTCFSLPSNFDRLISESKGSEELKALHGLRALSIAWIMLGHTYVWMNFQLLRRPENLARWFNSLDFGAILNGWLSVEPFFFLSGLLTCYTVMKIMPKTKGRLNVPLFILRRYIRLTPLLLFAMGLAFFMPILSSGPFWYERVDPEIRSCTKYWWRSILYFSNWMGMKNICVHPTWYLSADFQLYIISIIFLYALYRSFKFGLAMIVIFVAICTAVVATLTTLWELPPLILISSGNDQQIEQTVDIVHMNTLTHAGPYFVGIVVGYLLVQHRDIKMNKVVVTVGWCMSIFVSLTSLYGGHQWNIGDYQGPALSAIYACLHRTTFTIGVAWVAFACVTGYGGPVNRILSSSLLTPFSRLTFVIYVMHPLVIWIRMGSLRERIYYSHYNMLYEYAGNIVLTVIVSVPVYLLLEAPLSNLERMVFSRNRPKQDGPDRTPNGHVEPTVSQPPRETPDFVTVPVQLKSVKCLENGHRNLGYHSDVERPKSR